MKAVADGCMSVNMHPASARPLLRSVLLSLAITLALWLVLLQGNELWLPPTLQPLGHALYRVVYWITLPAQVIFQHVTATTHHHIPAKDAGWSSLMTATGLVLAFAALRSGLGKAASATVMRRGILVKLSTGLGLLATLSLLGLAAWGVLVEPSRLTVRRYTVPIADLPTWAEGLRIVQVSDTHYGPYIHLPYIRKVVAKANSLDPDVVVLTGDYIHRTPRGIPDGIEALTQLEAPLGRFAVLGNHDHWADAPAISRAFTEGGVRMLDGQHVYLTADGPTDGEAPDALCLAGLGDLWEDEQPVEASLEGVDPATPRIVLSHNPDYAEYVPEGLRVDLIMAGHTHGGQVYVPGKGTPKIPSRFGQWYAGGLCRGPRCRVLVSRGVGLAYLPVRLGIRPEIVELTLTRGPDSP